MAQINDYKVSYVRITEEGLERHNDVMLSSIPMDERKDIKSLTFLPVATASKIDITDNLKGFGILENLYLPSMMYTTIKDAGKECTMLRNLLILHHGSIERSLDKCVVKVNAIEEEGDNTTEFRTFVTTTKDGKQTFLVNSRQVINHDIVIVEKVIERLTMAQVQDYLSGENGIMALIEQINGDIEDERCKIEISQEILEGLLAIFVEKGVTFEEFTIDFSKLYDKIESYKSITKSVNQVSIKEEIEAVIIESYQNVLLRHYESLLGDLAQYAEKLVLGTTLESEGELLLALQDGLVQVVVDSPSFDEDYKEGDALDTILSGIPSIAARFVKSTKERGLVRKYLTQAVSNLKSNREELISKIDARLNDRASLEETREFVGNHFGLDLSKKQPLRLVNDIVSIICSKNFGILTKDDIKGIIVAVEKEMGNGEIRSKEMLEIVRKVTADYPTKEEIKQLLADFIAKNGFSAIKVSNK